MSVMERLQEIGILKSMGAMAWDIVKLIWLETLLLCLAGGVVGAALALGTAKFTDVLIRRLLPYTPTGGLVDINFGLMFLALGAVILIGLLSGIYPAWKAGRVRPLESMRSEVE
jgi:putative ABC transport system permease protein